MLRKLLVATRNTTVDLDDVVDTLLESTGNTDPEVTSTVPNQVGSSIEPAIDQHPDEELASVADNIFDLEEDDWNKRNTTRENPMIDLFLHPTLSSISVPINEEEENKL